MNPEWLIDACRSLNEVIEFRGEYVIHRYSFSEKNTCDFYAAGPREFRRVLFDVSGVEADAAIEKLRAEIDSHKEAAD